jgi:CHAD domain-containing protein
MAFPASVLYTHTEALFGYLPAVCDGDVEGIHQARVVTRRLREALPLFANSFPQDVQRVTRLVKSLGRKLGRARQLDVMDADLARLAGRMPLASHAIAAARRTVAFRQTAARRRLIKTIDDLRLDRRDQLRLRRRRDWWHPFDETLATGWATVLRERVTRRADQLNHAVHRAAGVYFPNRVHEVRIAAKKLRYSAELAACGGLWPTEAAVADLKKAQDTLGRLHDAHVLLECFDNLVDKADADAREVTMVKDDLHGQIAERYAKYLPQRKRLGAASRVCADFANLPPAKRSSAIRVAALSAVAARACLFMLSDKRGTTPSVVPAESADRGAAPGTIESTPADLRSVM